MPASRFHRIVDATAMRRVFVFADLHGCLDLLTAALIAHGYDPAEGDVAIGLGDWMDRGPAGLAEINAFLDANPEILWIRGNHEDMLLNACQGDDEEVKREAGENLFFNGGRWILDHIDAGTGLPNADAAALAHRLNDKPVAMTVLTPGGKRIGLVHAAVPADSWPEMVAALEGDAPEAGRMAWNCIWDRQAANLAIAESERGRACPDWIVGGIDHVLYGHTPVEKPIHHGNQSWIDTGAYKTRILTMVDLDQL